MGLDVPAERRVATGSVPWVPGAAHPIGTTLPAVVRVVAPCLGWRAMKKLLIVALLVALGVGFVAARRLREA
jgi:hypothetical protein